MKVTGKYASRGIYSVTLSSILLFSMLLIMDNELAFAFLPNNTKNDTDIETAQSTEAPAIKVQTDKKTYRLGDFVEVSGTVNNMKGETLRLDIYMPDGLVLQFSNGTSLSNIRLKPDSTGMYTYTFQLPIPLNVFRANHTGDYIVSVTNLGNSFETTFTVANSTRP